MIYGIGLAVVVLGGRPCLFAGDACLHCGLAEGQPLAGGNPNSTTTPCGSPRNGA